MRFIDITGREFHRLTALRISHRDSRGQIYWQCRCDCGNEKIVAGGHLRGGSVRSCGCLAREAARKLKTKHGGHGTQEYAAWTALKNRCLNPNNKDFKHYGERGIAVDEVFQGADGFLRFLAEVGPRPSPWHSIDRIDNERGYEPGNLRWSTQRQQVRNSRMVKPVVRSDGKRYATATDAADGIGSDVSNVIAACRGRQKTAGGYGWSYQV